jgi:hypothetical protein
VEFIMLAVGGALAYWVLLPCVIGAAVYYVVVKAIVGVHWLLIGKERRALERRRKQIRIRYFS